MGKVRFRQMEEADLDTVAVVAAAAFEIEVTDKRRWRARLAHGLRTDPAGSFVAERDGRVIGAAEALRRERLWCLSLLVVDPTIQGGGAGRGLIEHTLGYRDGTDCGLIVSSNDPRALHLYATTGFSLRPTLDAVGPLEGRKLPIRDRAVRDGGVDDLGAIAAISRELRGAPHTAELRLAIELGGRLLVLEDRGFAVAYPGEGVWMLAAREEHAAAALLRSGLAVIGQTERASVRWITAGQDWAVDVVLRAGLQLTNYGALCVRGDPGPLRPFIPSPPYA